MTCTPVAATPESFRDFGKVFKIPKDAPLAQTKDFSYWSNVVSYNIAGETEIGWCTVYRNDPAEVGGVERHMRTPEVLIPVDAPFILPVMQDAPGNAPLKAFRVEVGEAIVIGDGVWHGACLPVGKPASSYFVIFRKGTPQEDVEKKQIDPVRIAGLLE